MFGFRSDGDRVKDLSPTRAIMPYIMPTRTESQVFFELVLDEERVMSTVERVRAATGLKVTLLHLVLCAAGRILAERPRLNRFVAGGRIYQRRGVWVSFSAKRDKSDAGAVVALKRQIPAGATVADVVKLTESVVGGARSGKKDQTDKELGLVLALPGPMVRLVVFLLRSLDRLGLMPRFMIDGDPMYASLFVANLGSIDMDAPFHHLYEWGNIPLFCAIGRARDGKVPFRFTFDERVEDGLYCLKAIELLREVLESGAGLVEQGPTRGP
ncbi:MAG: hypothetical protein A2138_06650 [Deltaproteobacteria bacterium RBG_16_71_12]|nr:MAG: hypothetical protein A2138_06650 [Deltaproteobacteria bacterium RBG_16_71_12]